MAGANKVTDAILPEVHADLILQIEVFSKSPFGFLGVDGTTMRLAIGYTEVIGGICTAFLPATRKPFYVVLSAIMVGGSYAHYSHGDEKGMPVMVLTVLSAYLLSAAWFGSEEKGKKA